MDLQGFKNELRYLLDCGFGTNEIADDIGTQYQSVLERLRRNRDKESEELRARLIALRRAEKDARGYVEENWSRTRCPHGWWSKDGECIDHKKSGRVAA